jgi:branched-chain amino acid transport system substrate-binding protein
MPESRLSRREMIGVSGVAAIGLLTGCGSVGDEKTSGSSGQAATGPIKVGLVIPQAGVYAPLGVDMKAGWDLYLSQHGRKLGGREVKVVIGDEGEGPETGVPAVQRLLNRERVDLLVGVVNSATALGVKQAVSSAKKLLLVSNAGAGALTGDTPYVWRTSFTNGQVAYAIAQQIAKDVQGGRVFAMAPDYAAGEEAVAGFKAGLQAGGGKVAGQQLTPFGKTEDFQPYLTKVRSSGAKAVYAFYSGAEAVAFVKQYAQFGLSRRIPLYGSGFLTEGGVLKAQGAAADGVKTALHYSTELDNPANQKFVSAYQQAAGAPPTTFAMQTYDAAAILDRIVKGSALDGDTLSKALGKLGEITDSPRGSWSFDKQSPKQKMYLREVEAKGATRVNGVVKELGEFAPDVAGS